MAVSRGGVARRDRETCDCNCTRCVTAIVKYCKGIVTLPGTCKALSGRPGVLDHGRPVDQGPSGFLQANWGRVLPSNFQLQLDTFSELGDQLGPPRFSSWGPPFLRRGILLVRP